MGDQTPIGEYYLSVSDGEVRLEEAGREVTPYDPAFQAYERDFMAWVDAGDDDTRAYVAAVKFNELPDIVALSLSQQTRDTLISVFSDAPDNRYAVQALPRLKRAMLGQGEFQDPMAPDLDRQYFAAIQGLDGQEQATAAARFVNGLPEGQAMALMPDTQLHVLTSLQQARRVDRPMRQARMTIHDNIDQGLIYDMRREFREELADTLAADPVVQRGVKQWAQLDDEARRDVLQHVADTQNRLPDSRSLMWCLRIRPCGKPRRGSSGPEAITALMDQ